MEEFTIEELVDTFLDHARYLRIKHHVPGRIRVKATWNGAKKLSNSDGIEIDEIITLIPGIRDYRANPKALSVIINYDPEVLPFELWEEIGRLGEFPLHRDKIQHQLLEILNREKEEA